MLTSHEAGAGGLFRDRNRRRASGRLEALRRRKRQPFLPDFHDLERRMMPLTFTVNTTADSGAGSLRQAITDSNATPGSNTIDFSIGAVGSQQEIVPLSALPEITNSVLIDGWSQGGAGYTGAPLVAIDGTTAVADAAPGDRCSASSSAPARTAAPARGLVVSDFPVSGTPGSS